MARSALLFASHLKTPRSKRPETRKNCPAISQCLKYGKCVAGAAGFEPAHADTKNRCLTAWLRPKDADAWLATLYPGRCPALALLLLGR